MFQTIDSIDKWLLPMLMGGNDMFSDEFALLLTNGLTWIPLYIGLVLLVVKNNEKASQTLLVFAMIALALLFTGGLTDIVVKPLVGRLRPVADPSMASVISAINGYVPSGYSFFSAHAANTFAVAVFMTLLVRKWNFTLVMLFWAVVNAWTRLYLGAHYPSDVLVGAVWGTLVALLVYRLYRWLYFKISTRLHYISNEYTRTGYGLGDIEVVNFIFLMTLIVVVILSCILAH